ncbi:MAG: 6-carboxyhexanoate--CoA ligase [Thermodesulfovibrionales bacterium]
MEMSILFSIRMRASQQVESQKLKVKSFKEKIKEIHISGAEGIYKKSQINEIVRGYIKRALEHPRGKPDRIVITIEELTERPEIISTLPLSTIRNSSPTEGEKIVKKLLHSAGVSGIAIHRAFEIIKKDFMRGASIITNKRGKRLEPDKERGVRVSRLGISESALKELSKRLSVHGINNETVREALILASKVSSCEYVIAELCVSDDPDYTTGYIASKKFGYVRIPNIKNKGSKRGGRAFFVKEYADIEFILEYLEKKPIMIGDVSLCRGITSLDEILNSHI